MPLVGAWFLWCRHRCAARARLHVVRTKLAEIAFLHGRLQPGHTAPSSGQCSLRNPAPPALAGRRQRPPVGPGPRFPTESTRLRGAPRGGDRRTPCARTRRHEGARDARRRGGGRGTSDLTTDLPVDARAGGGGTFPSLSRFVQHGPGASRGVEALRVLRPALAHQPSGWATRPLRDGGCPPARRDGSWGFEPGASKLAGARRRALPAAAMAARGGPPLRPGDGRLCGTVACGSR